jgi:uncharacterized membrane protein YfcA
LNTLSDIQNTQWLLAFSASFLLGFSKSGLKGIGIIIVTLMALAFEAKASTGIILPLLIVGDILAVFYYKKHTQWVLLFKLLPWMIAGVLIGVILGKDLPEAVFKNSMAGIILISVIIMYWWEQRKSKYVPDQWWFAGIMGILAGITTMIGNLAGAFSNIFFLAMRLPKNEFIGTAAWLFFIINLIKLPFHYFVWGTVNTNSLLLDLRLIPMVIIGFIIGVRAIALIKDAHYRSMILILTAIGGLLILLR